MKRRTHGTQSPLITRLVLALVAATAALVLVATATVCESGSSASPLVPQGQSNFVRQIQLTANDIVFSPVTGMLYASVPSSVGPGGNRIATLDPTTGAIINSVYVGSEPNKLALADDGQTLFTALDGAFSIRRFNIQTQTPGQQFVIGSDSFFGRFTGNDLAVAPGNPNLLAVARFQGSSPAEAGVAVYENGVQRPNTGPGHIAGSDYIAFSASASTLYGGGPSGGLRTMTVDVNGITPVSTGSYAVGARVKFDNGLIFSSSGQVINASSGVLLGTFLNVNTTAFVSDSAVGRAYYLTGGAFGGIGSLTLQAFDINTFLPIGSVTIPNVSGTATTMVRWGGNGLAFRTSSGQVYVVQTSLIPSSDPIPTPTATVSPTPTPSPVPPATFVRQIRIATNDLIFDPMTQLLYASLPSSVGAKGNSITSIDPVAGTVGGSAFIGSEPTVIAQCDDGHTIYVALDGAGSVRRFDLATLTAGPEFSLGQDSFYGVWGISDVAVAPGGTNLVAVSRTKRGISPPEGGVAVFDNGVQRAKTGPDHIAGSDYLVFASSTQLYGTGPSGFSTMTIDASGVNLNKTVPFASGSNAVQLVNGLVYGGSSQVIDPNSGAIVGSFTNSGVGFFPSAFTVDAAANRIFFLSSNQLSAYRLDDFLPVGSVALQGVSGTPTSLVRWGANGLAFRTSGGQIYLLQTALVDQSIPVPTPTPTPSPSPSPSPPYVPAFIRKLDLQANDIVIDPATQLIYASVPSSQGANGNSIAKIDPQTAATGPFVFVGSEPNKLAISSDGGKLHVSLDGAAAIRQFDVASMTPGPQFTWGTTQQRPSDMKVVPGAPLSIATADGYANSVGVAIYDNGVRRSITSKANSFVSVGPIAFGADGGTIYGFDSFTSAAELLKMKVDNSGVSTVATTNGLIGGAAIQFSNGLLYSSGGRVADPEAKRLTGTFSGAGNAVMLVDETLGRAFFLWNSSPNLTLAAYDTHTYLPLGTVTLNVTGTPTAMVRWGANGLAFRVGPGFSGPASSSVYLLQSTLVSPSAAVPTGVQVASSSINTIEFNPTAAVAVNRTGDVSSSTSIDYATIDGTATAGSDYTATTGTLTFAPGELSKTITVPIVDDHLYEAGSETFSVVLSNPTGGAILNTSATVVTIVDNDSQPAIQLSSTLRASEGNNGTKTFVLPLSLSNPSVQTVSVNYATSDTTASAGSDYVAASGTLVFPPGTTSNQINLTVNGDTTIEPDETFVVRFTNPTNASFITTTQVTVTISNDDSSIQLSAAGYVVSESAGAVNITVTRTGDTSVASSVAYGTSDSAGNQTCSTLNGIASSRCDYITAIGTVNFAVGQTSKNITLLIIDDAFVEGNETLSINLSNPTVSLLGSQASATITITDNDTTPGANPVDQARPMVGFHYYDFLGRSPDQSGWDFWTNQITSCGGDVQCIEVRRIDVSASFFLSIEFQQTGYLVERFYKVAYGDASGTSAFGGVHQLAVPIVRFDEFLRDTQRIGQGVIVLQPGWEQVLENNKQVYALEFVQAPRFVTAFPATLSPELFVEQLSQHAGNVLSPAERGTAINSFAGAADSSSITARAKVVRQIAEDTDLYSAEYNRAFVLAQYFGYLRRNPDDPHDTDYTGYDFWLTKLNQFNGNYLNAEMVKAFLSSIEYRQRFGP